MKVVKKLLAILAIYLVLGAVIGLAQLALTKVFEPPCEGTVRHTLWEAYGRNADASDVLLERVNGKSESYNPLLFRIVKGTARWLPDLYRHVISGPMTVRDYLLGGYRCVESPVIGVDSLRTFFEGLAFEESITQIMDRAAGSSSGAGATPGGRAAAVLSAVTRTIEPIEGITVELPGNWIERDRQAAQQGISTNIKDRGIDVQIRQYMPPGQDAHIRVSALNQPSAADVVKDPVELRELAESFSKTTIARFEQAGFSNVTITGIALENTGNWPGFRHTLQGVDSQGRIWDYVGVYALTPKRQIQLHLLYTTTPSSPHRDVLERARKSLKIAY